METSTFVVSSCIFICALLRVRSGVVMIAVIDYKAGNLISVVKALRHLGADDIPGGIKE